MTLPAEHDASSPHQPSASDLSGKPVWRWSWPSRVALLFTGVILPVICFAIDVPFRPDWQSGNLGDYAKLLLLHKPACPFYPLLLYCMACMTLMIFKPARFSRRFIVRLGIYSGVLVAIQYWVVFGLALGEGANIPESLLAFLFMSTFATAIPWGIGVAFAFLIRAKFFTLWWVFAG